MTVPFFSHKNSHRINLKVHHCPIIHPLTINEFPLVNYPLKSLPPSSYKYYPKWLYIHDVPIIFPRLYLHIIKSIISYYIPFNPPHYYPNMYIYIYRRYIHIPLFSPKKILLSHVNIYKTHRFHTFFPSR